MAQDLLDDLWNALGITTQGLPSLGMLKQECQSIPDEVGHGLVTRHHHTAEQMRQLGLVEGPFSCGRLKQIAEHIFSRSTSSLVHEPDKVVLEAHKAASALHLLLLREWRIDEH